MNSENKPKSNKKKKRLLMYGGATILSVAIIGGAGLAIYDGTIDHLNEKCPLCSVVGLKHQANQINSDYGKEGYYAYYQEELPYARRVAEYTAPIVVKNEDGTETLVAPEGYVMIGDKAVKYTEFSPVSEQVIVTQRESVICEDGTCHLEFDEVRRFK